MLSYYFISVFYLSEHIIRLLNTNIDPIEYQGRWISLGFLVCQGFLALQFLLFLLLHHLLHLGFHPRPSFLFLYLGLLPFTPHLFECILDCWPGNVIHKQPHPCWEFIYALLHHSLELKLLLWHLHLSVHWKRLRGTKSSN